MIHTRTIDSYHFGFSLNLAESHLRTLTSRFHHPNPVDISVLGGRTAVTPLRLAGIGSVVVKHYRRGGLMRYFNTYRYLKFGKTRSQREFEQLERVDSLGINVPQPIAFAHCGRLAYQAWLVTRKINQPLSLAQWSLQDGTKIGTLMESVIQQISLLIQNNILHVDLHPGNVVVDAAGKVYLLDFDKGRIYPGSRRKLKKRYLLRWQRAVAKHGLPKALTEKMQRNLQ